MNIVPMQVTPPSIIKVFLLVPLLVAAHLILGCATTLTEDEETMVEKANEKVIQKSFNQRVYRYNFDAVWRAAQLALKYPIAINNMDNGTLETEWIKANDGFHSPSVQKVPSNGIRYKVQMMLVKGTLDNKESVRITILKKIERQRDFFSDPENIDTDEIEEKVLFYRIERELVIDEGLKKAANTLPGSF